MALVALSTKAEGGIVKIQENGVLQEFYVAKHGYVSGRTLLVRRYIYDIRQWHTSRVNAYASSVIDSWLTDTYLALLPADIQAQIAAVNIPYTPGNGNNVVSTLARRIFLLSVAELGKNATYANVEGSSLPIANTLQIATNSLGVAQVQWTRTPVISLTTQVYRLYFNGNPEYTDATGNDAVRPAFTLPSTIYVDDAGNITLNTPPVINYSGQTSLGNKTAGFTVNYSVSDAQSDAVTVTEKMDNVVKRSYAATLGQSQTFQAVLPANFQTILNGNHTLTLEATDGKVAAVPVNITFTKAVYSCSITLTTPLTADAMPTAMRLSMTGSIPADAIWTAEVCNNGNDAVPTWENIKPYMQSGNNYVFTNKSKTAAKWGINFRISVQRGASNTGGYIYSVEGGFQ